MFKIIAYNTFIIFYILIMISSAYPGSSFGPWGADVKIADENKLHNAINEKADLNVYSAPQGGAFFLIRFFQIFISPQDGPGCRFKPTCSHYGKHAVLRYGSLLGSILAGERLLRCNPYSPPGPDPVPQRIFE